MSATQSTRQPQVEGRSNQHRAMLLLMTQRKRTTNTVGDCGRDNQGWGMLRTWPKLWRQSTPSAAAKAPKIQQNEGKTSALTCKEYAHTRQYSGLKSGLVSTGVRSLILYHGSESREKIVTRRKVCSSLLY